MDNRLYVARQVNALFRLAGQNLDLTESEMMQIPDLFAPWEPGKAYAVDTILRHGVNEDGESQLWRVAQPHTSQADWEPGKAPSLFVAIGFTEKGHQIWTQPHGAHDAYMKGDKVSHNGELWKSTIDVNIWAPGVHGWKRVSS